MNTNNNLTSGVYQIGNSPHGDWDLLKKDTNDLKANINTALDKISNIKNTGDNEKIKGYKNSLETLSNKINIFKNKIDFKNGEVKPSDEEYSNFLESRYYIEKENANLTLLSSTVEVLILTKEI